ncbi:MAG: hypothetical protein JKY48_11600 [Flavobacteriales bacterium]|nr:hypothetical protein [Flavobacteriales bacterium]
MDILHTFYIQLGNYISILPLIIGLVRIRKLNPAFLFLLLMIACETAVAVYSKWQATQGINNIPSLHLMTFLEMLFGGAFFYLTLTTAKLKKTLFFLATSFLFYTAFNSLFIQSIEKYNQIPRTLEGYLFVVFCFFFFYELLIKPDLIKLSKSAEFWTVIGFFTYFGTTQFVHLFSDYTSEHYNSFHKALRGLNRAMIIVYYSIFTIALLMENKKNSLANKSNRFPIK